MTKYLKNVWWIAMAAVVLVIWPAAHARVLGAGAAYRAVPGWGQLPPPLKWGEVPNVAIDPKGTVFVFTRTEPPVVELTPAGKVYVLVRPESLNGLHTVEFLRHLVRYAGRRLLVIWDGSPIHRRAEVKEFLGSKAGRGVWVERLPGYAPDLNPWDEGGWDHLKHVEMRNLVCLDLEELHLELHLAIGRLRQKPHLIRLFFKAAGLAL